MRNVLITGGCGFIGVNFVKYWSRQYPRDKIIVLDALTYAADPKRIEAIGNIDLVVGNICDTSLIETILVSRGIDLIVNFAAETHVDRSISGPDAFLETNVLGTHSLLKAARKTWLEDSRKPHRFHQISTDEVYGSLGRDDPAFTELNSCAPNSPYSASKASADHFVRAYHKTYGLDVTITRCSNNYGPHQFPEKLIPLFIKNAIHGIKLPVYGDGSNIRDWLHVEDHCRGIDLVISNASSGEIFNIGGGKEISNLDLINLLCENVDDIFFKNDILRCRFPHAPAAQNSKTANLISFVSDRPGHDRRYAINDTLARTKLGFKPSVEFKIGFFNTIKKYIESCI